MRLPDINESRAQTSVTDVSRVAREAPPATTGATAGPQGADTVHLSGFAGRISEALSTMAADNLQKLQSLSDQYQSGTYAVSPMEISRALLAGSLRG